MLTYSVLAGLLFGLYFSLIGLGLNLVFGVMRIVNLAHGDFLMLGAFLAFWLFTLFALNPVPALVIAFVAFVAVGPPNTVVRWPASMRDTRAAGSIHPNRRLGAGRTTVGSSRRSVRCRITPGRSTRPTG